MTKKIPNTEIEILNTNSKKVLLIDDDDDQLFVLGTMLKQTKVEVTTIHHNQFNPDDFPINEYSCIVADVMMPRGGGLALLNSIRARNSQIPVIMTSAGREDLKQELLDAGASEFCPKYDQARSLYHAVTKICLTAPDIPITNQEVKNQYTSFNGKQTSFD